MEGRRESVIGPTLKIRGRVRARNQELRILGHVEGVIDHDDRLTVDKQASVAATLACTELTVSGQISGDVYATGKVSIGATGKVVGQIFAPLFCVAEGARLDGSVEMGLDQDVLAARFEKHAAAGNNVQAEAVPKDGVT